jgi:hypothetical protein
MVDTAAKICLAIFSVLLLTEDWRPEIPGINAPGDYLKDYAPNPWKDVKGVIDRVLAGRYDHFFPGEH